MATKKDGDQFISTREAAKLLGVSLTTAQTMAETGVLRSWKTRSEEHTSELQSH